MDEQEYIEFLEQQVEHLGKERERALRALDLASNMGNFETSLSRFRTVRPILDELSRRASSMIGFSATGIYLVDEHNSDFDLHYCDRDELSDAIEDEVENLILDQSFSWALEHNRTTFFLNAKKSGHILLHPLATESRIRGMFVGLLACEKKSISDITLSLFSVAMFAGAHALESYEFYRQIDNVKKQLEVKIERRTRELEAFLEQQNTILETMQAGMILVDPENFTIVDINRAALELIGSSKAEIIGRECFDGICPMTRGNCPIIDKKESVDNAEKYIMTLGGEPIPILKSVVPVKIHDKNYLLESFVDISKEKKLAQLREDVDRVMRHDLKTPLTGVIGIPDLLLEIPGLSDEHVELLEMIKQSGYRILSMINISHDLFKMETGVYELNPQSVNIVPIIGSIKDELRALMAGGRSIRVHINGTPSDDNAEFYLVGESLLFYSLFSNLIKNALEASTPGGRVSLFLENGDAATVRIHNAGVIPEEIRHSFFDKYVTHGKTKGTGLGTYSARLIVDTLGGKIDFETSEETGTTIRIEIPMDINPS